VVATDGPSCTSLTERLAAPGRRGSPARDRRPGGMRIGRESSTLENRKGRTVPGPASGAIPAGPSLARPVSPTDTPNRSARAGARLSGFADQADRSIRPTGMRLPRVRPFRMIFPSRPVSETERDWHVRPRPGGALDPPPRPEAALTQGGCWAMVRPVPGSGPQRASARIGPSAAPGSSRRALRAVAVQGGTRWPR
jgi:hypothetical protein